MCAGLTLTTAHADTFLAQCTGKSTTTFAPRLGPLPEMTSLKIVERYGAPGGGTCLIGPFASATGSFSITQPASCLVPPSPLVPVNVITYRWKIGQASTTSTIVFRLPVVSYVAGQLVVISTGTITRGYAKGSLAIRVVALIGLNLTQCLGNGVTTEYGPATLTIL